MKELNLFPSEDTLIVCKTPDGQSIEIDAMEIDAMLHDVYTEKRVTSLSLSEMLKEMTKKFEERFGFKMSLRSMDILIHEKDELLISVKKNTYQLSEPSEPTE